MVEELGHLGDSVCYTALLPIHWVEMSYTPSALDLSAAVIRNEQILVSMQQWEEGQGEVVDDTVAVELQRIEAKLNVLLEWVGQLLRKDAWIPDALPVTMHSQYVSWQCATPPPEGVWLRVDIYVSPHFPKPLVFFGQSQAQEPGLQIACISLIDQTAAHFEKFLFRQHRRAIASLRNRP